MFLWKGNKLTIVFKTKDLMINEIKYDDLNFVEGEAVFLSGPSGCGKSTLVKLFNGTISPSSGSIYYYGKDISKIDTIALRREASLVTQEVYLFDSTIKENFKEFYSFRELAPPGDSTIEKYLKICCLDLPITYNCSKMSGGERQRVYIAIFLSLEPKVLFLDEPTSALDSLNSNKVISNILDYCKEMKITPIIISHDTSFADKFSGRKIDFSNFCHKINL